MISFWHWHTEPALIIGLLAAAWLYGMGIGPGRPFLAPGVAFPRKELVAFSIGLVVFYLAVGSPLDAIGENYLFSAHMLQHLIFMYISAPILIYALPAWLIDGVLGRSRWLLGAFRFIVHPVSAGFIFTFTFSVWHFPAFYEAALHSKRIHMFEHLTMFFTSVLMFWPILSRSELAPRRHYGVVLIYLFALMVVQIPLFGILTFSTDVLYPTYEFAPRLIPALEPLQDQVLGGLIMKVGNMVVSLIIFGWVFLQWNADQERITRTTVPAMRLRTATALGRPH